MSPAAFDSPDRTLTPAERRDAERLLPALQAWTAYLTDTATAPTGSFERALERRCAVLLRHRTPPGGPLKGPVAVCPMWAFEWAVANGHRGNPGTGSPLTCAAMCSALDFMRAFPARTFRPLNDPLHDRRRRDGFYHLTGEMHTRLWAPRYVPVLTPRPGRPLSNDRRVTSRTAGERALRRADDDPTMSIVRDWARVNAPTALQETAVREGRPLAVRSPGRMSSWASGGVQVGREHVLGTVEMLFRHAVEHAGRGGWRVPGRAELATLLAGHAETSPTVLAPVVRFSTVDMPTRRRGRDWWRFALAPLGCGLIDPGELLPEVMHWRAMQARPGRSTSAARLVLPPDVDPASVNAAFAVDMLGWSEEQYEQWKAGL